MAERDLTDADTDVALDAGKKTVSLSKPLLGSTAGEFGCRCCLLLAALYR